MVILFYLERPRWHQTFPHPQELLYFLVHNSSKPYLHCTGLKLCYQKTHKISLSHKSIASRESNNGLVHLHRYFLHSLLVHCQRYYMVVDLLYFASGHDIFCDAFRDRKLNVVIVLWIEYIAIDKWCYYTKNYRIQVGTYVACGWHGGNCHNG